MNKENWQYYGVCPKVNLVCPDFRDTDISLSNEAESVLASGEEDDTTILSHPKSKCYAIIEGFITAWLKKSPDKCYTRPIENNRCR